MFPIRPGSNSAPFCVGSNNLWTLTRKIWQRFTASLQIDSHPFGSFLPLLVTANRTKFFLPQNRLYQPSTFFQKSASSTPPQNIGFLFMTFLKTKCRVTLLCACLMPLTHSSISSSSSSCAGAGPGLCEALTRFLVPALHCCLSRVDTVSSTSEYCPALYAFVQPLT